ncbi:MAG: phosphoglycerate mutase family protein [Armatimonadetes bacterium]|nr:phosphoglycerate mutase family protein [Armatimonadota bacterium]
MNDLEDERRYLAVYRHAPTKKGAGRGRGSHLSAEGVALARRIGGDLGPFHRVYVSPVPRTLETALAMGFAVDDVLEFSCGYVSGEFEHHDQWDWEEPYVRFAELLRSGGALAKSAATDAVLWAHLLADVPAGGRVLIVSHGGSIEPTLVACLPQAEHRTWGSPFSHCDGVILTFAGPGVVGDPGCFIAADFRRAATSQ